MESTTPFTQRLFGEVNLLPDVCPKHQRLLVSVNHTLRNKKTTTWRHIMCSKAIQLLID